MTERVLIMRHASGLVNRARRMAVEKWPQAKLEVHDLAAYGKPPSDFRWDRYVHLLIDDEYLRKEGLLWISELRAKPNFPKIVRVPTEAKKAPAARGDRGQRAAAAGEEIRVAAVRRRHHAYSSTGVETAAEDRARGRDAEHDPARGREAPRRCGCRAQIRRHPGIHAREAARQRRHRQRLPVRARARQAAGGLKILKGEGSGDSDLLSRFVQEYFATSSIDSPYVAKVYEHGFTDSHAYIVMEYFPPATCAARIPRERPRGGGSAASSSARSSRPSGRCTPPASFIAISSPRT
jgi:hypothetical protein